MNDPIFWPALAWGLGCFTVFYVRALVIERRYNAERRAQLQSRLIHPLSRLALSRTGTIAAGEADQGKTVTVEADLPAKPRSLSSKTAAVTAFDEIVIGLRAPPVERTEARTARGQCHGLKFRPNAV